jgi:RimJ/RimL family protein N-acetyltransferase
MLEVHRATDADRRELWEWRNDPTTRAASLTSEVVSWDDHNAWFDAIIVDPSRAIYVGEIVGESSKVGRCRFDIVSGLGTAVVSINLNPQFRGRGLSKELLRASIDRLGDDFPEVRTLTAQIRQSNSASLKLFESAGFGLTSMKSDIGSYEYRLGE